MLTYEALVCQSGLVHTQATFYLYAERLGILDKSQGIHEVLHKNLRVISLLGGSGSARLVHTANSAAFLCAHLSVGDVLQADATQPDSPYTSIIEEMIRNDCVRPKGTKVGVNAPDVGTRRSSWMMHSYLGRH